MKYSEYKYLSLGMPLIANKDIILIDKVCNEVDTLKKGTVVYFAYIGNDTSSPYANTCLTILLNPELEGEEYPVIREELDIDYNYVSFYNYNALEKIDKLDTLCEGDKVVTGERISEESFIGAGQVVEVTEARYSYLDEEFKVTVKDQFGRTSKLAEELYKFDKTLKSNNKGLNVEESLHDTITFPKDNIKELSALFLKILQEENEIMEQFSIPTEDVEYALSKALLQIQKKDDDIE